MAYIKKEVAIEALVAAGAVKDDLVKLPRPELINMYNQLINQNIPTANNVDPTKEIAKSDTKQEAECSTIGPQDEDWTKFVLSKLRKNELVQDCPTADGLRRVFEKLIGQIVHTDVKVPQTPHIENLNRATAIVSISYVPNAIIKAQGLTALFDPSCRFVISDACEVSMTNTKFPFHNFPVATAVTTAEGRCFRKGLRLVKVQTSEEMASPEGIEARIGEMAVNNQLAAPHQRGVINSLCQKQDINLQAFLLEHTKTKNDLNIITYSEAQELITALSAYEKGPDNGGLIVPEHLLIKR